MGGSCNVLLCSVALLVFLSAVCEAQDKCGAEPCSKNINYDERCVSAIRDQISREIDACITYLAAAMHFSTDAHNRPGVAHMFFESAREERQHAFQLSDYLLMRGDDITSYLRNFYAPLQHEWNSVIDALEMSLSLEKNVTSHFTEIISTCERDWHAADFLTSAMLDEQHRGTRQIAGLVTQLRKMRRHQPNLAEYMFDLELQKRPHV